MPAGGSRANAGRRRGVPNKATRERALIAEQVVARAEMRGEKLAKEYLNDFLKVFAGMATYYQPTFPEVHDRQNPHSNPNEFERWAVLAVDTAKMLMKTQTPELRAILMPAPPPASTTEVRERIILRVFEGSRQIEGEVLPIRKNGG